MTLPEPLARKRDELACEYGEDEQVLGPYRDGFTAAYEILAEENEKLRDALEFYASGLHYTVREYSYAQNSMVGSGCLTYLNDDGKRARAALSGKEKRDENKQTDDQET